MFWNFVSKKKHSFMHSFFKFWMPAWHMMTNMNGKKLLWMMMMMIMFKRMCDGYKTLFVSCRFSYIIDLNSKLQFLKRKRFSEKKLLITIWCVFSFSFKIIIYKHIHTHKIYKYKTDNIWWWWTNHLWPWLNLIWFIWQQRWW